MHTIPAIVIKETDYRDNDKMLTLFSPIYGKTDVLSRGCKKQSSKLMASSQLFACGNYHLNERKGRYYHAGCDMEFSFFGLRQDYSKLFHASFFIELVHAFIVENQENKMLYALLLNCLYAMENSINDDKLITQFFLIKFSDYVGLRPNIDDCCEHYKDSKKLFFCYEDGMILCERCAAKFKYQKNIISRKSIEIIKETFDLPTKAICMPNTTEMSLEIIKLFYSFLQYNINVKIKSYKLINN